MRMYVRALLMNLYSEGCILHLEFRQLGELSNLRLKECDVLRTRRSSREVPCRRGSFALPTTLKHVILPHQARRTIAVTTCNDRIVSIPVPQHDRSCQIGCASKSGCCTTDRQHAATKIHHTPCCAAKIFGLLRCMEFVVDRTSEGREHIRALDGMEAIQKHETVTSI